MASTIETVEPVGTAAHVEIPAGQVRYWECGHGTPIVFVHGLLANSLLWRKVVPSLAGDYRCIVPDWPLGSHPEPMLADADLSTDGLVDIVVAFLDALDLDRVVLVGNDTGGALCQLVTARHPERVAGLVLTNCDAYDNFPPRLFAPLVAAGRVPGGLALVLQGLRLRATWRLPITFGWLTKRPLHPGLVDAWVRPARVHAGVRRDLAKVLRGIDGHATVHAAVQLRSWDGPTLLLWAAEDRVFPFAHAERLAADIPGAVLEPVADSYAFVSEDQPERCAELIARFLRAKVRG